MNVKSACLDLDVNAKENVMTDLECLAKLEAVLAENEALTARVQLLEKVNGEVIAVKDPYEDLKKEHEELKEQLEYLRKKLFDLYGIPAKLLENGSIKTATQLVEYQYKKFIEHLTDAINSCYAEPRD